MAYLKVDHSEFEKTASAIDDYVELLRRKVNVEANSEIERLSASWQGDDNIQFKTQWDKVTDRDSTHYKMMKTLESYAEFLRLAAKKYKDAQTKAINRANGLR